MSRPARAGEPRRPYAVELQHERTALAWERTAFALMGVGVVLARFAAIDGDGPLVVAGVALLVLGTGLLVWAQVTYELRADVLQRGDDVAHPGAARFVGISTTVACVACTVAAAVSIA